ncbi:C10 family peptidase [Bacteroidota bacterium]
MKTKSYSSFFICFLFIYQFAFGTIVPVNNARQVAINFYSERIEKPNKSGLLELLITSEITEYENEQPVYYVFNINLNQGYVIVAAEDRSYPVLGYTFNGSYEPDVMPPALRDLLYNYKNQLLYIRNNNLSTNPAIEMAWQKYGSNSFTGNLNIAAVSPLLNTTWDQGCYYNDSCPAIIGGPCGHVWVGCVAVAMGQVMKYWNYPSMGTGSNSYTHSVSNGYSNNFGVLSANFASTSYNWSSMANSLSTYNSYVAQLLFHCGVAVEMDYDTTGSGSYTGDARDALVNYFKYASTAQFLSKSSYSNATWDNMLKSELDSARPLIYRGNDTTVGHAWVLDGYQGTSNNHYHMNWGWGGASNGYFYLSSLNPGSISLNNNQQCIFGIKPFNLPPTADFSANPTSLYAGDTVLFTDLSTGYPASWTWLFQGGTPSTYSGQNPPPIIYNTSGVYDVSLIASNSYGSDTISKQGYINVASGSSSSCDTLSNLLATDTITYYVWTSQWGYLPGHNGYLIPAYADKFSNSNLVSINSIRIMPAKITSGTSLSYITLKVYSGSGTNPGNTLGSQQVLLSSLTNGQWNTISLSNPVSVSGNFFIGFELNYSTPQDTFVIYTAQNRGTSGTNSAYMYYNNSWYTFATLSNLYSSMAIEPIVCVNQPSGPIADFTVNQTNISIGDSITFTDLSAGNPTNWHWTFSGGSPGSYSGQNPPTIKYNASGNFNVRLIVSNTSGSDTLLKTNYIHVSSSPPGPVADFTANQTTITEGGTVTFTDLSTGTPNSWTWTFNAGSPSSYVGQTPPNITYYSAGNYDVKLVVSNANGSDSLIKVNYITVIPASSSLCDTLHYPLTGNKILYPSSGWGYVSGNNSYGDKAKADYFSNYTPYTLIHGAFFDFAIAETSSSSTTNITFSVWNNNGTSGSPGSAIGSTTLSLASISDDVSNQDITYVQFSSPIAISGPFYVGVILPTTSSDTLALYTNTDGDISVGTAWEQWSDNSWNPYNSTSGWDMDVSHAIFPFVCQTSVGVDGYITDFECSVYPNPTNDKLYLLFNKIPEQIEIVLLNSQGSEIIHKKHYSINKRRMKLDLSNCSKGLYYLIIRTSKEIFTEKIILTE